MFGITYYDISKAAQMNIFATFISGSSPKHIEFGIYYA